MLRIKFALRNFKLKTASLLASSAVCLIFATAGCGCGADNSASDGGSDADVEYEAAESFEETAENKPQARFPLCDSQLAAQKITFVHVNDLHSSYIPEESGENPYGRIRGYYKAVKEENPFTIFTDGGDDYEKGSVIEQISEGASTRAFVKAMKFDVRVIGNHDFAWSAEELLEFSLDPNAVVLAGNTSYAGGGEKKFGGVDWAEMTVGCVKIGFFGMVSKPWNEKDEQYDGDFYPEFSSRFDYAARAKEIVGAHRNEVDLIVMVSHLGMSDDEKIASEVEGIDAILGGHSHTTTTQPVVVNGTPIIQTGSNAAFIGRLDLVFSLAEKKVASSEYKLVNNISGSLPVDEEIQTLSDRIFSTFWSYVERPNARLKFSKDKNAIALIAAKAAMQLYEGDAALIDKRTIWKTWSPGVLNAQDLLDTFKVEREPSGTSGFNSLYSAKISGSHLAAVKAGMNEADWYFAGPDFIDEAKTYTFVLQKRTALNAAAYLPANVQLDKIKPASEAWQALLYYGEDRSYNCLYFDVDELVEGCKIRSLK